MFEWRSWSDKRLPVLDRINNNGIWLGSGRLGRTVFGVTHNCWAYRVELVVYSSRSGFFLLNTKKNWSSRCCWPISFICLKKKHRNFSITCANLNNLKFMSSLHFSKYGVYKMCCWFVMATWDALWSRSKNRQIICCVWRNVIKKKWESRKYHRFAHYTKLLR